MAEIRFDNRLPLKILEDYIIEYNTNINITKENNIIFVNFKKQDINFENKYPGTMNVNNRKYKYLAPVEFRLLLKKIEIF